MGVKVTALENAEEMIKNVKTRYCNSYNNELIK